MKKNPKYKQVLLVVLLSLVVFLLLISSYQNVARQKELLNQERLARMELEERVLSISGRNSVLTSTVEQLQARFQETEIRHQAAMETSHKKTEDVELELNKVTKLKEKLEENLKEALVSPGR